MPALVWPMVIPAVGRALEDFAALVVGPERTLCCREHPSRHWDLSVGVTTAVLINWKIWPEGRKFCVVVLLVHLKGEADLLQVAHALDELCLLPGAAERVQK